MATSLEKLFKLLEGSNDQLNKVVSKELGNIYSNDKSCIYLILNQIKHLLFNVNWETRLSAGIVLEEIISKLPNNSKFVLDNFDALNQMVPNILQFQNFDVRKMDNYKLLDGGKVIEDTKLERTSLEQQKINVQKQLMLGVVGESVGDALNSFISEDDFAQDTFINSKEINVKSDDNDTITENTSIEDGDFITDNKPIQNGSNPSEPQEVDRDDHAILICKFARQHLFSFSNLFNPKWEIRHGATIGIRHLLTALSSASNRFPVDFCVEPIVNSMIYLLVCDRFADYIGDEVIAPIREMAAQVIALSLKLAVSTPADRRASNGSEGFAGEELMMKVVDVLGTMLSQRQNGTPWEIRHGGALGFKYLLPILTKFGWGEEDRKELLQRTLSHIKMGLYDQMDDVIAISADVLSSLPLALSQRINHLLLPESNHAWSHLQTMGEAGTDDELPISATRGLLDFIARLNLEHQNSIVNPTTARQLSLTLKYISHSSLGVRKSALNLLHNLIHYAAPNQECLVILSSTILKHLFLRAIVEESLPLYPLILKCWRGIIEMTSTSTGDVLLTFFATTFDGLLGLSMHRSDAPIQIAAHPSFQTEQDRILLKDINEGLYASILYVGGFESVNFPKARREIRVAQACNMATNLLSILALNASKLIGNPTHTTNLTPQGCNSLWWNFESLLIYHLSSRSYVQRFTVATFVQQLLMHYTRCCMSGEVMRGAIFSLKLSPALSEVVLSGISQCFYFDELSPSISEMHSLVSKILTRSQTLLDDAGLTAAKYVIPDALSQVITNVDGKLILNPQHLPNLNELEALADYFSNIEASKLSMDVTADKGNKDLWVLDGRILKDLSKAAQHKHRSLVARVQARMSSCFAWLSVYAKLTHVNDGIPASASIKKLGFFLKPIVESLKLGSDTCAQVSLASDLCLHLALAHGQSNFQSAVDKLMSRLVYAYLPSREHQANKPFDFSMEEVGLNEVIASAVWKNPDEYFIPNLKNFPTSTMETKDAKDGKNVLELFNQPNLVTIAFMNHGLDKPLRYLPTIEGDLDDSDDLNMYTHLIALILNGLPGQSLNFESSKCLQLSQNSNRIPIIPGANPTSNGALITLQRLMDCFTLPRVISLLPHLWQIISPSALLNRMEELEHRMGQCLFKDQAQSMLYELAALQFTAGRIWANSQASLSQELNLFFQRLSHTKINHFRFALAKVLGALLADHQFLDDAWAEGLVRTFIERMLPHAEAADLIPKLGFAEGLIHLLGPLGERRPGVMLRYTSTFIVPVLGLMTDSIAEIRCAGSYCFSQLLPFLNVCVHEVPACFKDNPFIREISLRGTYFLQNFTKAKPVPSPSSPHLDLPFELGNETKLREYQEEGIRWLLFLRDFKLHGLLCDDMGLGKTLQTLCAIAYHYVSCRGSGEERRQEPLVSLIVCPSSLVYHWSEEIQRFFPPTLMKPHILKGQSMSDDKFGNASGNAVVLICSYETVRKRADDFRLGFKGASLQYLVLDEGHIIKNPRTKLTLAVKTIPAKHRLILSGTPIQNNVVELWSLFDFLMPGYLGTEKQFNARYSKPISLSRDAKHQSKELESGFVMTAVVALGNLHKQVLPFVMRRTKDQVLSDLPPKIIQDYACTLTWLQADLYRDYVLSTKQSHHHHQLNKDAIGEDNHAKPIHTFKALNYLRKICNHPALVLDQNHPRWSRLVQRYVEWSASNGHDFLGMNSGTGKKGQDIIDKNTLFRDPRLSGKLMALVDLLRECNIITFKSEDVDDMADIVSKPSTAKDPEICGNDLRHRALIFFQIVDTLEMTANFMKSTFPAVKFLTLQGSIAANERHEIVKQFNDNAKLESRVEEGSRCDLLLLTTRVGGLGLNLTGADTVIFFEHDWNPMKDLQAMDRAHRIGQKRTVNVYRLITKDTLEEKIMSLQKFKIGVANAVIDAENSDYSKVSQACDNVIDLFPASQNDIKSQEQKSKRIKSSISLYDCPTEVDYIDDGQYEEEFDLTRFMAAIDK